MFGFYSVGWESTRDWTVDDAPGFINDGSSTCQRLTDRCLQPRRKARNIVTSFKMMLRKVTQ